MDELGWFECMECGAIFDNVEDANKHICEEVEEIVLFTED